MALKKEGKSELDLAVTGDVMDNIIAGGLAITK